MDIREQGLGAIIAANQRVGADEVREALGFTRARAVPGVLAPTPGEEVSASDGGVLLFGIGERQLERRMREAFGVNLRDARRVVRFGWSLLHIIGMPVGWGDLTRIAHDSGYYDQAHMHKEYLDLAGISPIALLQKIASNDPAYWLYRLSEQDTKKLFLPVARKLRIPP